MGLLWTVTNNVRDARTLGMGMLTRHVDTIHPRRVRVVHTRRSGDICYRPHTSDVAVIREVLRGKQYDTSDCAQHGRIVAAHDAIVARGHIPLIIDLGGNIGVSARWFAAAYPKARIVAVEPDPDNAALCRRNTADLGVRVVEAAIGSANGFTRLVAAGPAQPWAIATVRDAAGTVPIVTVDDIVDSEPSAELFIVKIDIEGFESDLFAANTGWIQKAALVFIEPHDWMHPEAATSRTFQSVFGRLDFDILIRSENLAYVRR